MQLQLINNSTFKVAHSPHSAALRLVLLMSCSCIASLCASLSLLLSFFLGSQAPVVEPVPEILPSFKGSKLQGHKVQNGQMRAKGCAARRAKLSFKISKPFFNFLKLHVAWRVAHLWAPTYHPVLRALEALLADIALLQAAISTLLHMTGEHGALDVIGHLPRWLPRMLI